MCSRLLVLSLLLIRFFLALVAGAGSLANLQHAQLTHLTLLLVLF